MMKKILYYISAAALALGLGSCAKDGVNNQMAIVANISDNPSSKTSLSGDDQTGYQVLWNESDKIILAKEGSYSTTVYTLSKGAGSTSGTFVGDPLADGNYMAYYAYDHKQPEKFGEQTSDSEQSVSNAPMTAKFTVNSGVASSIAFRNACGLLSLNLKGVGTIKSIKITTNQPLVSYYENFREDGSMGVQDPPHGSRALKFITLSCGLGGRDLTENYQSFYIAMPPGDFTGVTIEVSDFDGNKFTKTLKEGKSLNIARAMITFVSFTVTGLNVSSDQIVDLEDLSDGGSLPEEIW